MYRIEAMTLVTYFLRPSLFQSAHGLLLLRSLNQLETTHKKNFFFLVQLLKKRIGTFTQMMFLSEHENHLDCEAAKKFRSNATRNKKTSREMSDTICCSSFS